MNVNVLCECECKFIMFDATNNERLPINEQKQGTVLALLLLSPNLHPTSFLISFHTILGFLTLLSSVFEGCLLEYIRSSTVL